MKRLYIAGPMTPRGMRPDTQNAAIEYLYNIGDLVQAAIVAIEKGWAPYCPALDYQYFLSRNGSQPISEAKIKAVSMAFLEGCHAAVFLSGWEASAGCLAELDRAVELGIRPYFGMDIVPEVGE